MADYSDIPPLVDGPSTYPQGFVPARNATPGRRQYDNTPYPGYTPMAPSSSPGRPLSPSAAPPWDNYGAQQQSPPSSSWDAQQFQQPVGVWPTNATYGIVSAPFYPAAGGDPAVVYQGDGWPSHHDGAFERANETAEWATSVTNSSSPWKAEGNALGLPPPRRSGSRLMRAASSSRSLTPYTQTSSPASSPSSGSMSSSFSSGRSRSVQFDEANKRPPREWRTDFSMTRSSGLGLGQLGSLFSFPSRRGSFSRADSPSLAKATLHPFLRYNSSHPPMYLDLRGAPHLVRFRELQRTVTGWDLTRFACEPPQARMRLYHSHWPWIVEVVSQNPAGVTLGELLNGIWQCMQMPITHADYWNNEMDQRMREEIAASWSERTANDVAEQGRGVRRVDYLLGRVILEGIVKGKDGMWEMKLGRM